MVNFNSAVPAVPECSQKHPNRKGDGTHSVLLTVLNRDNTVVHPNPFRSQVFLLGVGTGNGLPPWVSLVGSDQTDLLKKVKKANSFPAFPAVPEIEFSKADGIRPKNRVI